MWGQVVRKPLGLLIVLIASVTTLPSIPRPEQEPVAADRDLRVARASDPTVGKCLDTSKLIYVETVIVMKDDSSHVNGTITIFVGDSIQIDCARLVAKTEYTRSSLKRFELIDSNTIELSVAESQPSQSNALEYSVYVYATIESNRKPKNKTPSLGFGERYKM